MNGPVNFSPDTEAQPGAAHIVPRATIETIVRHRDRALELYATAYDRMATAADAITAADTEARKATFGRSRYNAHNDEAKAKPALLGQVLPARESYLAGMRKIVDTDVWGYVIKISELETVMDKTAKNQMHQDLMSDPPEATVDNIAATLRQFIQDADAIFKRGIAKCFTDLDRRFRSHDGWKIGSRIILSYAFDNFGWRFDRAHDDTLRDIERTFLTLDGRKAPQYGGIVDLVSRSRSYGSGPRQSEFENDYFVIRGFKNGNCHIWFKRDDLVDRVNQLLGEYYGAPIPEDREPDADTGLNNPKTGLAKNYGFFPTPDDAAKAVIDKIPLHRGKDDPPLTILEPSAGTGQLARRLAATRTGYGDSWRRPETEYRYRHDVGCVEFQAPLARDLKHALLYRKVYNVDFLQVQPATTGLYDIVAMNPPFDRERDIDHVMHALKFLRPGGFLIAIMSAGTEFRETRKSIAFRALMSKMNAKWDDLPAGSFSSVGTNCNTIILRVNKDGRSISRWS